MKKELFCKLQAAKKAANEAASRAQTIQEDAMVYGDRLSPAALEAWREVGLLQEEEARALEAWWKG